MNSEITTNNKQTNINPIQEKILFTLEKIRDLPNIDIENKKDFMLNIIHKVSDLYTNSKTQLDALTFIYENKPRDILEIYQLMNIFHLSTLTKTVFSQISHAKLTHEMLREYVAVSAKIASAQSKAMAAMRVRRGEVVVAKTARNSVKNVQNNTTNNAMIC